MGIGIFISPPEVAAHVHGPGSFMLIWLLGGMAALFGALSLAELGAMMPRDGGDYAYLRMSWGPGIAFAAGWTPCIGPILASILVVAASSGQVGEGVGLLSVYSLGLGIPFLLSGLLFHQFLAAFKRFRKHIRLIEICTGVMLIVVGVMLMFNLLGEITMFLYQWVPVRG